MEINKTYIINLLRKTDRKERMIQRLDQINYPLNYEFFNAVDGNVIDDNFMKQNTLTKNIIIFIYN